VLFQYTNFIFDSINTLTARRSVRQYRVAARIFVLPFQQICYL